MKESEITKTDIIKYGINEDLLKPDEPAANIIARLSEDIAGAFAIVIDLLDRKSKGRKGLGKEFPRAVSEGKNPNLLIREAKKIVHMILSDAPERECLKEILRTHHITSYTPETKDERESDQQLTLAELGLTIKELEEAMAEIEALDIESHKRTDEKRKPRQYTLQPDLWAQSKLKSLLEKTGDYQKPMAPDEALPLMQAITDRRIATGKNAIFEDCITGPKILCAREVVFCYRNAYQLKNLDRFITEIRESFPGKPIKLFKLDENFDYSKVNKIDENGTLFLMRFM